jgi:hypothetical protein
MKSNFISHLPSRTLYLSIILLSLVSYNFLDAAWTAPGSNPPTGNVAEPINESSVSQTKLGAFGTGPLLVDGDVQVIDASPSIKYNDNTSGEKAFWSYVNSNIYYILADRDGVTTTWEGNHPLVLYAGYTDSTTDYATFANEVRATSYCNRAGGSCFGAAEMGKGASCRVEEVEALNVNGNQSRITATCNADEVITGGGCNTSLTASTLQDFPSGNGWQCYKHLSENTGTAHRVFAVCCKK